MPRSSEIRAFADRIASLTIDAARTQDPDRLAEIKTELEETFIDAFSLIAHDAWPDRPTVLDAELLKRALLTQQDGGSIA